VTSVERLARLTKPVNRVRRRFAVGVGDGDVCPIEPRHGAMLILRPSLGRDGRLAEPRDERQYCPSQVHDNTSRAFWPTDVTPASLAAMASLVTKGRTA
jgi:hypothetical protein